MLPPEPVHANSDRGREAQNSSMPRTSFCASACEVTAVVTRCRSCDEPSSRTVEFFPAALYAAQYHSRACFYVPFFLSPFTPTSVAAPGAFSSARAQAPALLRQSPPRKRAR